MSSQVIGKYELFDKIAAGGMAAVHLGRFRGEGGFSRTVALKRLHPQFAGDRDFLAMFLDEARLASRIRHPNVVSTLDVVSNGGEVLLVMDYVVGESLAGLLHMGRPKPLPAPIAVAVMISVLHGLHAAHEAKTEQGAPLHIVHRDVSPQNILVGSDGVARVLDFGIAKAAERAHTTRDGKIKGKLSYMAPEQLGANPLDRRSDVYGAAVVLWECLVGEKLFQGETEAGVVAKVLQLEVAPPSHTVPSLPPALDAVVARGLARDVNARFATAREMAIALERCGVPPASISDVGEWVESVAGGILARRAQRVAAIEKETDPGIVLPAPPVDVQVDTVVRDPAPLSIPGALPTDPGSGVSGRYVASTSVSPGPMSEPARRSRAVALLVLVVVLIGVGSGGAYVVARRRSTSAPDRAATAAAPPAVTTAEPMIDPAPPPSASESALPAPPVTNAVASTSASAKAPRPRSAPVAAPAPRKADCSVPYVVDPSGIRRLKPECL